MMPRLCYVSAERNSCSFNMKQYMNIPIKEKYFKCNISSREFRRNCTLNRHNTIQETKPPFVCEICGNGFSCKDNLRVHSCKDNSRV